LVDGFVWRIGKLGGVLEYDCTYEGDKPVDYKFLVCAESGLLVTHHGGIQDAGLCMDWYWDVLG
jgi:hypothetical protein